MDLTAVLERVYLPLLTQETAVMITTLTYGLKEGLSPSALVVTDSAAIITDQAHHPVTGDQSAIAPGQKSGSEGDESSRSCSQ